MDVRRATIVVAVVAAGETGNATHYGTIPNTPEALEKSAKRLRQAGSGPATYRLPVGAALCRALA